MGKIGRNPENFAYGSVSLQGEEFVSPIGYQEISVSSVIEINSISDIESRAMQFSIDATLHNSWTLEPLTAAKTLEVMQKHSVVDSLNPGETVKIPSNKVKVFSSNPRIWRDFYLNNFDAVTWISKTCRYPRQGIATVPLVYEWTPGCTRSGCGIYFPKNCDQGSLSRRASLLTRAWSEMPILSIRSEEYQCKNSDLSSFGSETR